MDKISVDNLQTKKKRVIIISIIILLMMLIFISILLRILILDKAKDNIEYDNLKTVEDVLRYYKCKYISEKESIEKDFDIDINLVFRYNLYENDKSNQTFFENVINDIVRVLNYKNFRMIDKEKDINIEVICENSRISKIIINGIEDYFIYMDSQIELKQYVEIPITENIQIESQELQNLISNNWSNDVYLGTRDSIFDNYYIYFDEGIKARNINEKIYNIIFTKKYNKNVLNEIYPGMNISTIKAKLGEPSFKDDEQNIIGYKCEQIYVFFTENEISIYRIEEENNDDFFELVESFLNDDLELLDFMNELTYLWPDYSEYDYKENYAFISYPLKGIDVMIGYENTNGIVLYNNINMSQGMLKNYLEHPEFVARLKLDNVFEAEKRRILNREDLIEKSKNFIKELDEEEKIIIKESIEYYIYPELDENENILRMNFISKNDNYPDREIIDNISSYLWLNDYIFLYSQAGKGIYYLNTIDGQRRVLLEGEEEFKFNGFENGILKYDNEERTIEY